MSEFHLNKEYFQKSGWTVAQVKREIDDGLRILNKIDCPIVSFFGSHKVKPGDFYYEHAKKLAFDLGTTGYAVITGGGPGIMHAANSGAHDAKAISVGFKAKLLKSERIDEKIFTYEYPFHFFLARRFVMSIKSDALVFYPGGLGTLNELFEYAVLMQTKIVDRVPLICVGKKYWSGLFDWLDKAPLEDGYLINQKRDLGLFKILETNREIMNAIKS